MSSILIISLSYILIIILLNTHTKLNSQKARKYLENENKRISFISILLSLTIFMNINTVNYSYINLYQKQKLPIPIEMQYLNGLLKFYCFLLFVFGIFKIFQKPNQKYINNKLKKLKKNDLVSIKQLQNSKNTILLIGIISFTFLMLIISIFLPFHYFGY